MEKGFISFPDASRKAQTTPDRAKYWLKLLGINTIKRGNTKYISEECLPQLQMMSKLIGNGELASDAAKIAKDAIFPIPGNQKSEDQTKELSPFETQSPGRMETMEKAILQMADTFKSELQTIKGEIFALRQVNEKLVDENRSLRLCLEPPKKPTTPIAPWQPENQKDPLEGMTWLQRAYVQIVEPWRMRQYDS
ncbi:MAG: hypothetical protein Q8M94_05965 [Ignavibacteria bacterium]|nr:hypothetical protein [Ignavibacteria bacterium]